MPKQPVHTENHGAAVAERTRHVTGGRADEPTASADRVVQPPAGGGLTAGRREQLTAALAVAIQAGQTTLLWGPPGEGKSATVVQVAEGLDRPCFVVVGSIREPSDFAGLPRISDGGVVFEPPRWAREASEHARPIVFLDELTTAPPAVQAAMLRVAHERVVGDLALPEDTAVVAAANPPDIAADGVDLSAPLANRFCHLTWELGAADFARGLAAGWPLPTLPTLPSHWRRRTPYWRGRVAAFVLARPSLKTVVADDPSVRGGAWPSPRSWETLAYLTAASEAAAVDDEVRWQLSAGCVGDAAATEWLHWLERADLPDPETLLADGAAARLPDRGDLAHAALTGVVAAVGEQLTRSRWEAAWAVLAAAVAGGGADVAAVAARDLLALRAVAWPLPAAIDLFEPLLADAEL